MRHYNPRFVYFLPTFWSPKTFFQGAFFLKFWPYVWLVFKSGFQSRAGYSGARTVYILEWPYLTSLAWQILVVNKQDQRSIETANFMSVVELCREFQQVSSIVLFPFFVKDSARNPYPILLTNYWLHQNICLLIIYIFIFHRHLSPWLLSSL